MAIMIYGDPGSGGRLRVTAAAAAIGIKIGAASICLRGKPYARVITAQPNGPSPAMVDSDFVLYEFAAINL